MSELYPLRLPASLREKIWGSLDLDPFFGAVRERVGEAWYTFEENAVENGPLAGTTLAELMARYGRRLMGSRFEPRPLTRRLAGRRDREEAAAAGPYFPILSKLLFVSRKLSVQVHPDDRYALEREDAPGKTEAWHVVRAEEGATIALGLTRALSKAELAAAARSGAIEELLNWVPVRSGDTLFVPPGTVHTLGPGLVVCEIQQNSDLTYRLYDFGRTGADGRARELHIEDAVEVADPRPWPGLAPGFRLDGEGLERQILTACRYFALERLSWRRGVAYSADPESARILIFLEGEGRIGAEAYRPGSCYLIPAESDEFELSPEEPSMAIRAWVPDLGALAACARAAGVARDAIERTLIE